MSGVAWFLGLAAAAILTIMLNIAAAEMHSHIDRIGYAALRFFARFVPEGKRADLVEEVSGYILAASQDGRKLTAALHGISVVRIAVQEVVFDRILHRRDQKRQVRAAVAGGVALAPLSDLLGPDLPVRFEWKRDFLDRAKRAIVVCRFGEDFFENWDKPFAEFVRKGGVLEFVLPNPSNEIIMEAMDTQRPERSTKDLVQETLTHIKALNSQVAEGSSVSVRFVDRVISYDIYLVPNVVAIQAPYENLYRIRARCPVSIAHAGSELYEYLAGEAMDIHGIALPAR